MDFQDVVNRRRMVRNYSSEPIEDAVLEQMLANALHAPSAGFSQGWAFLVLDRPDDVRRFWAASSPDEGTEPDSWLRGMQAAPVVIVPMSGKRAYLERYAEPDKGWTDLDEARWPVPYWHIDTGMAALLILQTAVDHGLGACFFGIPPGQLESFRTAFGVPGDYTPIGAITVGHRAPDKRSPSLRRGRRTLDSVVHHHSW